MNTGLVVVSGQGKAKAAKQEMPSSAVIIRNRDKKRAPVPKFLLAFFIDIVAICVVAFSILMPGSSQNVALSALDTYAVGWYSYIGEPSLLMELKDAGCSLALGWPANFDSGQAKKYLDLAQSLGIKVIMSLVKPPSEEAVKKMVRALNRHPALLGWYIADEPEEFGPPPEFVYRIVSSTTPRLPAFIVHYDEKTFDEFRTQTDVLMLDHYPGYGLSDAESEIVFNWTVRASYDRWVAGIKWAKLNQKKFIAVALGYGATESGSHISGARDLSKAEYRYHVLSAIAAGADGLLFWHTDPQADSVYVTNSRIQSIINGLIAIVNAIGPEIQTTSTRLDRGINDPRVSVSVTPAQLVFRYGKSNLRRAILAVNIADHTKNNSGTALPGVRFTLEGLGSRSVSVVGENRTLPISNSSFTDDFAPFEVHAYIISEEEEQHLRQNGDKFK